MTKANRWAWIISLVAMTGAVLVLTFLLSIATNNQAFYERHYAWLFWVNTAVAGFLMLVIGTAIMRLALRVRRGKFGSRLLLKLAAIFALVGVVPGVLIYTVSFQFVSRSIESWFDVRVEGALDAGLNLGRGTLDALVSDLASKTRLAAERLADRPVDSRLDVQPLALERLREQLSAQDIAIVGSNGQIIISAGSSANSLMPDRPSALLLRNARNTRVVSQLEGLEEDAPAGSARIRALAFIPSANIVLSQQDRYLMVTQLVPPLLAANALAVQAAYREYQQRSLGRDGLRRMYIGTLTLTLILAVFVALLLAMTLSNQLARPLLLLAQGVREVAQGDLSVKAVFASRDELGGLTRSFAEMTEQLSDAREMVQRSVTQVEGARTNLQTILDNLTAGVIVFDREGRIDTVNPGATRILRLPLSAYRARPLDDVPGLEAFAQAVRQRFDLHDSSPEAGERDQWQDSFELQTASDRDTLTLLVRGARMPQGARLMVFDDITEVVSAQRSAAWSEVARRLAHEIKNPLTPIQLSAERMRRHFSGAPPQSKTLVDECTATIVGEVESLKGLVDEFSQFARMPSPRTVPTDIGQLITDTVALYNGIFSDVRIAQRFAPGVPLVRLDVEQIRRVIINLIDNAIEAMERRGDIVVETQLDTGNNLVKVVVADDGPGIPPAEREKLFLPYYSTKRRGSGLGLAIVRRIIAEHGGSIEVSDNTPRGTRFTIELPC